MIPRLDKLTLDIDCRMVDLWREVDEVTVWDLELAATFMRAAFGAGYCQAAKGDRSLLTDHGYAK